MKKKPGPYYLSFFIFFQALHHKPLRYMQQLAQRAYSPSMAIPERASAISPVVRIFAWNMPPRRDSSVHEEAMKSLLA